MGSEAAWAERRPRPEGPAARLPIALPIRYHDVFDGYTMRPANNGWKTCRRGHEYRGGARCLVCWKGNR